LLRQLENVSLSTPFTPISGFCFKGMLQLLTVAFGPWRHFTATQQTVAFRGIATLTPATLPTGGGSTGGSTGGSKGG
jgi:hypothetical protein